MTHRVLICEPSEIVANGLSETINSMSGFAVVSRIDTPDRLSEKILASDVNILIVNPILLGYSERNLPIQLVKEYPHLTVIAMVTTYVEESVLKLYGGVIELNDSKLKIINNLKQIVDTNDKADKNDDVELSKREVDVLVVVAKGLMNKEIADQMNISIHTVISHRKNITRKTGIKSVPGLTVYALLNNLIDETEVYK